MRNVWRGALGLFGILVLAASTTALAEPSPKFGILEGRIVEGDSLAAVEGATIILTDAAGSPIVVNGRSDANGKFRFEMPVGTYDMLAVFGEAKFLHHNVVVRAKEVTQIPACLALDPEVVTIHEKAPKVAPPIPAEVEASTVKRILPYSDDAILEDAWTVAWLLLDVDTRGTVTSFRFVHRPGHGLDDIAEKEAFKLHFSPAKDKTGQPVASQVLWKFEWPAFHYTKNIKVYNSSGPQALERPLDADAHSGEQRPTYLTQGFAPLAMHIHSNLDFASPGEPLPPCRGQGQPLNLDSHEPLYRDCATPDITKLSVERKVIRPDGN